MVMIAFGLYSLWNISGAIQKAGSGRLTSQNPYKLEWEKVQKDKNRTDVSETENWQPTKWSRIIITFVFLGVTALFFALTLLVGPLQNPTQLEVVLADVVAIIALVGYRFAKELAG